MRPLGATQAVTCLDCDDDKRRTGPSSLGFSGGHERGLPTQAFVHFDRIMNFAVAEQMRWPSLLGMFIATSYVTCCWQQQPFSDRDHARAVELQ
jgi:hypothetical protein